MWLLRTAVCEANCSMALKFSCKVIFRRLQPPTLSIIYASAETSVLDNAEKNPDLETLHYDTSSNLH
jgi:hypothetical protein